MKTMSRVLVWIGIWLMVDNGSDVHLGLGSSTAMRCFICEKDLSIDCKDTKAVEAAKESMSMDCLTEFNRLNVSTVKGSGGMTFDAEWKHKTNLNASFVCVKQEVYVTSKDPPGAVDENGKSQWDESGSLEIKKPTYVSRFCGIINTKERKLHKQFIDEVGGKFAARSFICKSKDYCNGSDTKEDYLKITITILLSFSILHFISRN